MEWVKAIHVIAIIAWMAGLLYLPRLFVYHAGVAVGSEQSETFKVMERRLYFGIMTPAMIAAWIFGLWLAFGYGLVDFSQGWMHLKALMVVLLTGYQGMLGGLRRKFAADANVRSARFFRFINEVPTLMMIVIVIAVIVKPF
jgi:protoporphyrinogen IX oxidase